ncbi:MAG: glutamine-hydrolyzing carbamoyl-phosphate synthase small subunit [Sphingomonadales bacterium]
MTNASSAHTPPTDHHNAVLVLADGTIFWGFGLGRAGSAVGEVCFNTAMTGYQEIMTDPSYAGQIVTFTFPHIGNVGANGEDVETTTPAARGMVIRQPITDPSNFRAERHLNDWLKANDLVGIAGVDTRSLTRHIRQHGAPNGVVAHRPDRRFDIDALLAEARAWPGLEGMDLARDVTAGQTYQWDETRWQLGQGYGRQTDPSVHVVAVDYGIKRNILRNLAQVGARVTVVPCTASYDEIMAHQPDGIFLSNGPGDPAATGAYALPVIKQLIASGKPIFGICLGHQLLGLALGAKTVKMHQGHRGANHPVKELATGKVEVTSMNHGFTVDIDSLPQDVEATHISLFDGTLCGLKVKDRPIFSVQQHPEASPGPQDSYYLFDRFIGAVKDAA